MTDASQLEAGCFRHCLERILALDGSPAPDELKREIAAALMICDAGTDTRKLLAERDRRIRMQDIICKFAFEQIATLEERLHLSRSRLAARSTRTTTPPARDF